MLRPSLLVATRQDSISHVSHLKALSLLHPFHLSSSLLRISTPNKTPRAQLSQFASHLERVQFVPRRMADVDGNQVPRTKLIFQLPEHQETAEYEVQVAAIYDYASLPTADQALLKVGPNEDTSNIYALVFDATIFHAQGGGQPSDVGYISRASSSNESPEKVFNVLMVRQSVTKTGIVLHFGRFVPEIASSSSLRVGDHCVQRIDMEKRMLFSRYHTGGHVLGTATRTLLENKISGFDELKASHFPDSASCEFLGLIEGKWKGDIQVAVDELLERDAEVRIEWWTKADFKSKGLERLLPSDEAWKEIGEFVGVDGKPVSAPSLSEDDSRIRVVNIVGAEVYPCGGTHVATTKKCGKVGVRKISRQKGTSRISYNVG